MPLSGRDCLFVSSDEVSAWKDAYDIFWKKNILVEGQILTEIKWYSRQRFQMKISHSLKKGVRVFA